MNPLLQAALASLVRSLLAAGAGWLVQHHVWTNSAAEAYLTALSMWLVSYGWSLWQTYHSRLKFMLALDAPATATESQIHEQIAAIPLVDKLSTALGSKH